MEGALIDPGGDVEHLLALAKQAGVTLTKLLLTHGHIDHVGGASAISRQLGIPIEGPQKEEKETPTPREGVLSSQQNGQAP